MKFNFLNYQPRLEDEANPGLNVADNVLHEPEGYKPIYLRTASAFTTAIAPSGGTIHDVVAKSIGSQGDVLAAWIHNDAVHVGVNGATSLSATTGYPASFATTGTSKFIYAFDVCEAYGRVFFTVEARQTEAIPSTVTSVVHCGYMDFE